jgi:uncharacterized repeat protein (TIGR02543 family)
MLKRTFLPLLFVSLFLSCNQMVDSVQDNVHSNDNVASQEVPGISNEGSYTVEFISDINGNAVTSSVTVSAGDKLDKPDDPVFPQHAFAGWFTSGGVQWDFDNDIVSNNIVLYSKFDNIITFDLLDGSEPFTQAVSDNSYVLKPSLPSRGGYAFVGWYSDKNYTAEWRFRSEVVTEPFTLYAKWTDQFNVVTFDTNDNWTFTQNVPYNSVVEVPEAPIDSNNRKLFEAWLLADDSVYDFASIIANDITLYAKWVSAHVISFDIGIEGYSIPEGLVKNNDSVSSPAVPVIDGLDFYIWVDDSGTEYDFKQPVTSSLSLRAVYLVTLTFDSQGGGAIPPQTVARGGGVVYPGAPSKKLGYSFGGWYTKPLGGEPFNFIAPLYSHTAAYARWDVIITFDTQSNNLIGDQRIQAGSYASIPEPPSRYGYVFVGWFTAALIEEEEEEEEIEYTPFDFSKPVEANQDLYARYYVTVTFSYAGGGIISEYSIFEDSVFPYTAPRPSNFWASGADYDTFDDWYEHPTSGSVFDFSQPISKSIILYARWGSELVFDAGVGATLNGSRIQSYFVKTGDLFSVSVTPVKTGHDFTGWWTMTGGTGYQWDFANYPITENTTLYAGWTLKIITITLDLLTGGDIASNQKAKEENDRRVGMGMTPIYTYIDYWDAWKNGGQGEYSYYYGDDGSFAIIFYLLQLYEPNLGNLEFSKWCYDRDNTREVDFAALNSRSFNDSVSFYAARYTIWKISIQYKSGASTVPKITEEFYLKSGDLCPLPNLSLARYPTLFSVVEGFYGIGSGSNDKWDFLTDRVYSNKTLVAHYTAGWKNGGTDDWYHR